MSKQTWYLAGPMTGIPQFNFPLFKSAAEALREVHGIDVLSPAEVDSQDEELRTQVLASEEGDLKSAGIKETWGDFLARDVKLIADLGGATGAGEILDETILNEQNAVRDSFHRLFELTFLPFHDLFLEQK